MSDREVFTVEVAGGSLAGWVTGDGPRVILLHGGPGLSYAYMEPVVEELQSHFRVATFQQRGLAPSTREGPFTIAQAIDDVASVITALDWPRALVVGHSWGGHLALRFAAARPELLLAVLAIDPGPGIVGDGGRAAFEAELIARVPKDGRDRFRVLEEREKAGEATPGEGLEAQQILWGAYFANPENVPPLPPLQIATEVFESLMAEVGAGTDEVVAALSTGAVRYGVVAGAASPMPWGQAARASVEVSPNAFLHVITGAGHFVWYESPGAVRSAVQRLIASA
ncbi:MAG: alpha/beta hydrolase [Solirubrobacteraceae bacterium]